MSQHHATGCSPENALLAKKKLRVSPHTLSCALAQHLISEFISCLRKADMAELEKEIHGPGQESFAQCCQPKVPCDRPLSPAPWLLPDCRVSCSAGRTTLPCPTASSTRGCPRRRWRSRGAARRRARCCTPSTSSWASATATTAVSHGFFLSRRG